MMTRKEKVALAALNALTWAGIILVFGYSVAESALRRFHQTRWDEVVNETITEEEEDLA